MKILFLSISFNIILFFNCYSRDGMWMPQLLKELNESEMRSMGMKLSSEDIYSVNHSSLKDAVLQFGGGCTGSMISAEGLLITNHHCGFSQIQSLSTIEKNYVQDGYWSKNDSEEIPCPGLTVTFIREITDVTDAVLNGVSDSANEDLRNAASKIKTDSLEKIYSGNFKGVVRPFFAGNKYYLFKTEIFTDIRFVAAPPSSIGKFGGETDNWIWPRHDGDFGLYRIYADSNNLPAPFSKNNLHYKPRQFLTINIGGIKENDFAFVFGFPGRTQEYLPASALKVVEVQTDPNRISLRDARLNVLRAARAKNDTLDLKYAAKFSTIENAYKKWNGELLGFKRSDVVNSRVHQEEIFNNSLSQEKKIIEKTIISKYDSLVLKSKPFNYSVDYFAEGFPGIELLSAANKCKTLIELASRDTADSVSFAKEIIKVKADLHSFYKNYDAETDKKLCAEILKLIVANLDTSFLPSELKFMRNNTGEIDEYVLQLYKKSYFSSEEIILSRLLNDKGAIKNIQYDPAYSLALSISENQRKLNTALENINRNITRVQREYMKILIANASRNKLYPDANSTLRVSYGKIEGMEPYDGMKYNYFTTAGGIIEKNNTGKKEYIIPQRLRELILKKDFGKYAFKNTLPVAFITSSHTTGGNSGSPVLNAKGELIGINYDRVWEGVLSDYYYEEKVCRNISLDIRYVLFLIDKFGEDKRLLEEMKIVTDEW